MAAGHVRPLEYSPRQALAYLWQARRREALRQAEAVSHAAMAAQGKGDDVQDLVDDLIEFGRS